jgi:hypothetical protein
MKDMFYFGDRTFDPFPDKNLRVVSHLHEELAPLHGIGAEKISEDQRNLVTCQPEELVPWVGDDVEILVPFIIGYKCFQVPFLLNISLRPLVEFKCKFYKQKSSSCVFKVSNNSWKQ